jgi:hypothetical protein
MPYTVTPTALQEVLILEPKVFGDDRGFFFESFNQRDFASVTGLTSSTLPACKWMIPLEMEVEPQTTKRAWRGLRGLAVSNPVRQTVTSGRA